MLRTPRECLIFAGIFALLAVIFGAIGSHSFVSILDEEGRRIWTLASSYQMFHSLALAIVAVLWQNLGPEEREKSAHGLRRAALCFVAGILCFSGSLYSLTLDLGAWLGPVTPLGGLLFMIGWIQWLISVTGINK
jgi:uncharacterized membrane protein YgdD (TMEM256/DUF423 family)